jgi:hypothetical protein
MSYKNLILSDRPISYWSEPKLSRFNNGSQYSLYDEKYYNDAKLISYSYIENKPLIFNGNPCVRLNETSYIEISNVYKYFVKGTENKIFSMDFWFSIRQKPSGTHNLFSINGFVNCYIKNDKIYLQGPKNQQLNYVRVDDWESQHYINFYYSDKKIGLYLDDLEEVSITLDSNFAFNEANNFSSPDIIFGPASTNKNILPESSKNVSEWQYQGCSISNINSDYYSGGNCIEISKLSSNFILNYIEDILVEPYTNYCLSCKVKIPDSNEHSEISIQIDVYDENDQLLNSYSHDELISSSDNWTTLSVPLETDIYSEYIKISISEISSGAVNQKVLFGSILLEKEYYPSEWSETFYTSDPLFIGEIAIYSYVLTNQQRERRINYGKFNAINSLAIENQLDIIQTSYQSQLINLEKNISNNYNSENLEIYNFIQNQDKLIQPIYSPETISTGSLGGSAELNRYGIKFVGDSYIDLFDPSSYFNPSYSTIKFQMDFKQNTGDGTILLISPVLEYDSISIEKKSNKILISAVLGENGTTIIESSVIAEKLINVALNFSSGSLELVVDDEIISESIPTIQIPCQIIFGNTPGKNKPLPDSIRNLSFDDLTEYSNINWTESGKYTLRFNNNLNVSQKSEFNYEFYPTVTSNNSLVSYNFATDAKVFVNEVVIDKETYIPNFNYGTPELTRVSVEAKTEDSLNDPKTISNLLISVYDSSSYDSSLGEFSLQSKYFVGDEYLDEYIDPYGGFERQPYIASPYISNILSNNKNLGIRFDIKKSTGCRIVSNSINYRGFEFAFKLNDIPKNGETYTLFDINGTYTLVYSDQGFSTTGNYNVYIDGEIQNDIENFYVDTNQNYYIFIELNSNEDIYLGISHSSDNLLEGSMGNLIVYRSLPIDLSDFINKRYSNILGKITVSEFGGVVQIIDQDATPQSYFYSNDRDYFKMESLPKVKIISDI